MSDKSKQTFRRLFSKENFGTLKRRRGKIASTTPIEDISATFAENSSTTFEIAQGALQTKATLPTIGKGSTTCLKESSGTLPPITITSPSQHDGDMDEDSTEQNKPLTLKDVLSSINKLTYI